jgi:hypothetical protein
MTSGGVLLVLFLLSVGALAATTLVVTVRGGRGPGDPPSSRPRVDPAGFFVLSTPRGLSEPARRRRARAGRPAFLRSARSSRRPRRTTALPGRAPSPGFGRTSARLP